MNKGLKGLLVALIAVGYAGASTSNNKTHLNTLMYRGTVPAYTTFHEMTSDKNTDRYGGNLEVTGFYARSFNDEHLAKNFGANGTNSVRVLANTAFTAIGTNYPNVPGDLLLHDNAGTNPLAGIAKFEPKQTLYGAQLDYYHRFDRWVDGLFASLRVPFLHVTNDINMKVDHGAAGSTAVENITLVDILSGKSLSRTDADDRQDALANAKMCSSSKSGFGDITAKVGYKFIEGSKCHAGVNLAVVFPTASEPDAQFKWAARTGDSKWALGGGADGSAVLWEDEDQNLKVIGALNYKYLFSGTERRTIGLKKFNYTATGIINNPVWSEYYLVGRKDSTGLRHLANVTTMNVKVEMGSQLDGTVALAYNNAGFSLDVGYNLFWREAESVKFKTACSSTSTGWAEDTYAIARKAYDTSTGFVAATDSITQSATDYLKNSDLDFDKAATPAYSVHKFFCGVGYVAKNWEYPVMVGTGVSFEFPSSNRDTAEGYSFWAKAGIQF